MSVGKKYVTKDDSEAFARKLVRRLGGVRLGGGGSTPGGGGVSAFTELSDVPSAYFGEGLKGVRVNAAEGALEFFDLEIGALGDVDLGSGPNDGDVLVYDGSSGLWVPGPGGGVVPALCDLIDVDCSSPFVPQDGDVLVFDGSSGLWVPGQAGDMTKAVYDTDDDGQVEAADYADDADKVDGSHAADFAASAHFHDLDDLGDVDAPAPNDDDVLAWDGPGGKWVPVAPAAGGNHDLLSATHPDTVPASPVAGDLVRGNATPEWEALAAGAEGQILEMGAALPGWADLTQAKVMGLTTLDSPLFKGLKIGGPRLAGYAHRILFALPIPTADLVDFPVKVPIVAGSPASIAIGAACLASGYDIRFTAADGVTLLSYERESFAVTLGEATGIFWVKSDVAMAGTYIWCYYGNAAAGDVSSGPDVFDTEAAVYHMNDGENTSHIHDSSANANHGTKKGANEPAEAVGKIGMGQSFNGGNDYIYTPSFALTGTALRFSALINTNQHATAYQSLLSDNGWGVPGYINISRLAASDTLSFEYSNGTSPAGALATGILTGLDGAWVYISIVADYAGKKVYFYRNGAWFSTADMGGTPQFPSADRVKYLGAYNAGTDCLTNGLLDEVRLSEGDCSAAWIAYEYANMNPADGGLTWGAEEELNLEVDADANVSGVYRVNGVQVVGAQQAAITDADSGTLLAQFNTLLAELRILGLIDT